MDDGPIRTLARVDMLDRVEFTVDGETITGWSDDVTVDDASIRVMIHEQYGDRTFQVVTEWANGWLEPLVDVLDPRSRTFRPFGTLDGIQGRGYPLDR